MIHAEGRRSLHRRFGSLLVALVVAIGTITASGPSSEAEELVDLTLLFHSAVQGKIAPCG